MGRIRRREMKLFSRVTRASKTYAEIAGQFTGSSHYPTYAMLWALTGALSKTGPFTTEQTGL